jgi:hypothetical protein
MKTTPDIHHLPAPYAGYVAHVAHLSVLDALSWSQHQLHQALLQVPEERGAYAYASGKWSIKEVMGHLQDVERVFAYRALRFARNDATELPGFDEVQYASEMTVHTRTLAELTSELERLRATTIDLFRAFTPTMLQRSGVANGNRITVCNIGYVIAGHTMHHLQLLQNRYGI